MSLRIIGVFVGATVSTWFTSVRVAQAQQSVMGSLGCAILFAAGSVNRSWVNDVRNIAEMDVGSDTKMRYDLL